MDFESPFHYYIEAWESITPPRGATPKRGSWPPRLEGPHQSVGVHPNSRCHAKVWGSITRTHHSGGPNQKWPTSGQIGYITTAILGVPNKISRGKLFSFGCKSRFVLKSTTRSFFLCSRSSINKSVRKQCKSLAIHFVFLHTLDFSQKKKISVLRQKKNKQLTPNTLFFTVPRIEK